ncbi:MAG: hypothetical protein WCK98_07545 [bacterium]
MPQKIKNLEKKWEQFWLKFYGFDKKMKILEVDFSKPWWVILWRQKFIFTVVFALEVITNIFNTIIPIVVGYSISESNYNLFYGVIIARLVLTFVFQYFYGYNAIFQLQSVYSVYTSGLKFFMKVDPLFHSTRSSGTIISKLDRGSAAYEKFLDIVCFEFLPTIIAIITVTLTLFSFDWKFGLTALTFIILVGIFNIHGSLFNNRAFVPGELKREDMLKEKFVENLQQTNFIRSIFATESQFDKFKTTTINLISYKGTNWQAGGAIFSLSLAFYYLSILVLSSLVFNSISIGQTSPIIGTSLVATYLLGTGTILYFGDRIRRLNESLSYIKDLFQFIQGYGKQTYPVLDEDD